MHMESRKAFLIHAAYYAVIVMLILLFIRCLLPPLSPFIFGILAAWFLQRPARALCKRLHMPMRIAALLLTLALYSAVFAVVLCAGLQVISALEHFVPQIPAFAGQIVPLVSRSLEALERRLQGYDPGVVGIIDRISREIISSLEKLISSVSVSAVRLASSLITGLPSFLLTIITAVVSTCFAAVDFDRIRGCAAEKLPARLPGTVSAVLSAGADCIRRILVSWITITALSFVELSIGFILVGVRRAVGLALLVAVIDAMPVLGAGLVLIPWSVIAAMLGDFRMASGAAALYVVMLVVRSIAEPRLVSRQTGLHPLLTLVSMFAGLRLFGLPGLLGCPLALSLYIRLSGSAGVGTAV